MADMSTGIGKLRTAMLIYLVAFVLSLVGYILGVAVASSPVASLGGTSPSTAIPFLILFIIVMVLAIVALFFIRSGFSALASNNRKYGIGATGALIELVGAILFIVAVGVIIASVAAATTGGFGAAIGGGLAGLAFFGIGGILGFVGTIMLVVGFYRIGSDYNSTAVKVGAIFYILFSLIGVILLYVGLKDAQRGSAPGAKPQGKAPSM